MIRFNVKESTIPFDTKSERVNMEVEKASMVKMFGSKIGIVELLASKWVGEDHLYSQVVDIEGVTEKSQVDLTPSVEQLLVFYDKDLTLVTENDNGVVTVYAIGQQPTNDYTIQVTIFEVKAQGKIVGATVGTPTSPEKMAAEIKPIIGEGLSDVDIQDLLTHLN